MEHFFLYIHIFLIIDSINSGMERLFEDVVEDFSELHSIRERFEEWRSQYSDTYKEAYIGLCLPKLINPFVRLQLVNWNPLEVSKIICK